MARIYGLRIILRDTQFQNASNMLNVNSKIKVALAMIVKGEDREADLLDRCLSGKIKDYAYPAQKEIDINNIDSLYDNVDGIFITLTQKNDKCEEVANKYGANISHYEWNNSFADARNTPALLNVILLSLHSTVFKTSRVLLPFTNCPL